jgi:hypothetical protein
MIFRSSSADSHLNSSLAIAFISRPPFRFFDIILRITVEGRSIGRLGSSSHDFNVSFRSGVDAVLRVSVRHQMTLEYFMIPSRQPCAELWVSTCQTETMDASSGGFQF